MFRSKRIFQPINHIILFALIASTCMPLRAQKKESLVVEFGAKTGSTLGKGTIWIAQQLISRYNDFTVWGRNRIVNGLKRFTTPTDYEQVAINKWILGKKMSSQEKKAWRKFRNRALSHPGAIAIIVAIILFVIAVVGRAYVRSRREAPEDILYMEELPEEPVEEVSIVGSRSQEGQLQEVEVGLEMSPEEMRQEVEMLKKQLEEIKKLEEKASRTGAEEIFLQYEKPRLEKKINKLEERLQSTAQPKLAEEVPIEVPFEKMGEIELSFMPSEEAEHMRGLMYAFINQFNRNIDEGRVELPEGLSQFIDYVEQNPHSMSKDEINNLVQQLNAVNAKIAQKTDQPTFESLQSEVEANLNRVNIDPNEVYRLLDLSKTAGINETATQIKEIIAEKFPEGDVSRQLNWLFADSAHKNRYDAYLMAARGDFQLLNSLQPLISLEEAVKLQQQLSDFIFSLRDLESKLR